MTGYHVQYAAQAVDDLRSIYRYLAEELQAPQAAQRQVERIRKIIRMLSSTPARFPAVAWEPWASMGMRQVPVNNYIVFYLVEEERQTVSVVRIFYGGRNIEDIVRNGE